MYQAGNLLRQLALRKTPLPDDLARLLVVKEGATWLDGTGATNQGVGIDVLRNFLLGRAAPPSAPDAAAMALLQAAGEHQVLREIPERKEEERGRGERERLSLKVSPT